MKILVLSQYFWPENFRINELTKELNKSKKIQVEVLTSNPSYPNKKIFQDKKLTNFGNIKINRVPTYLRDGSIFSKIINYITFVINASIYLLFVNKVKYDKIFVFQVSPVFSALPAIIYSKFNKSKIHLWVLDLWPESIFVFGYKSKVIFFLIKKISDYIYSNVDILYGQSKSITKILRKRYKKKTFFLPNWSESIIEKKVSKRFEMDLQKKIEKNKFNVFFGGNIGKAQDFKNILKSIVLTNKKINKINWYIFGEGSEKQKILNFKKNNNIKNIFLFNGISQKNLYYIYKKYADFALVCLSNSRTLKWTIPGKIQFYFQCKTPIIGMMSGEAKSLIEKAKSGFVVNSGNYSKFSNLLVKISKYNNKKFYKKMGTNGFTYSKTFFNKKKIIEQLAFKLSE